MLPGAERSGLSKLAPFAAVARAYRGHDSGAKSSSLPAFFVEFIVPAVKKWGGKRFLQGLLLSFFAVAGTRRMKV
jgi:hypothetical protein